MGRASLPVLLAIVASVAMTVFFFSWKMGLRRGGLRDYVTGANAPVNDLPSRAVLEAFSRNASESALRASSMERDLERSRTRVAELAEKLKASEAAKVEFQRRYELLAQPVLSEDHVPVDDNNRPSLLDDPPEGEVDIAFHLQVHAGTLQLVPRVLRAIWHPRNTYAVHFDQGSLVKPEVVGALMKHIKTKYDNVFVMNAETITYGGITIVLNTLSSISLLLRLQRRWDYWINLSGNDYPLVHPAKLRRILARTGKERLNFVEFNLKHGYPTLPKDLTRQQRFYYGWFDTALVKTMPTVAQSEIDDVVAADSVCLAQWAWERTQMNLVCPNNKTIVEIKLASFGRPYGDVCTDDPQSTIVPNCHAKSAPALVAKACLNRRSCSLEASNDAFGSDPCPGFTKWLAVAVQCRTNGTSAAALDSEVGALPEKTKVLQSKREYIKRIGHNPMVQYRDFHIVKTEFWMILSREFCNYLLHEQYPRRMLSYFSTTFIPDEHYIGTVLWNSPRWRKTLVPTSFHTVNWRIGRIRPSTLSTRDDLAMLRRSRNFFARKFAQPDSVRLINSIDGTLTGNPVPPDDFFIEDFHDAAALDQGVFGLVGGADGGAVADGWAVRQYESNVTAHFDRAIALRNDLVRDGYMDSSSHEAWHEVMKQSAFYLKPRAELGGSYTEGRPICVYEEQGECVGSPVYAKWLGNSNPKMKSRFYLGWIERVMPNGDYVIRWKDREARQRTAPSDVRSFY